MRLVLLCQAEDDAAQSRLTRRGTCGPQRSTSTQSLERDRAHKPRNCAVRVQMRSRLLSS
jgi:hypothetical protein